MLLIVISMLGSGLTAGIGHKLEIGKLSAGMNVGERAKIVTQQGMISASVRTGLSEISGEKPSGIFRGELLSGALAMGQSIIGDIGAKHGLENGSVTKTAMHSTLGGVYSASVGGSVASGLLSGAISELVPSIMGSAGGNTGPASDGSIKATTQLAASTASFLTGGNAEDIGTAGHVATSAITHNYLGHRTKEDDDKVRDLSDSEIEQQYTELKKDSGTLAWFKYSPYETALESEYFQRFGGGLDTSNGFIGETLNMLPQGGLIGAGLERVTGKDLGMSSITTPDFTSSKFNTPKNVVTKTQQSEKTSSILTKKYDTNKGSNIKSTIVERQQNVHIVNAESSLEYQVPGRVQSRIDLYKPGWNHVVARHFNANKNASQYNISQNELRKILQSKEVVHSPIKKILNIKERQEKWSYLREVDVGRVIGIDKFTKQPTTKITILTNYEGQLRSALPGRLDCS